MFLLEREEVEFVRFCSDTGAVSYLEPAVNKFKLGLVAMFSLCSTKLECLSSHKRDFK